MKEVPAAATVEFDDPPSLLDQIPGPEPRSNISTPVSITQQIGRVMGVAPLVVRFEDAEVEAQRAVSCLVAPERDDRVLVAITPEGPFVLAVLSRTSGAATTIATDGDLRVNAPKGRFAVASRDGIDLASAGEVQIAGAELGVTVARAKLVAEEIVVLGAKAIAEVAQAKLKGTTFESIFERTLSRVKRSFRTVEETDNVRAGDIDYKAEASIGLRSQNTVMTATELIKADAEQIHFG